MNIFYNFDLDKDAILKNYKIDKSLNKNLKYSFNNINQIISSNISDLSFYNDYSIENKIDSSIFIDDLEHNKIIFINGRVEEIEFSYED